MKSFFMKTALIMSTLFLWAGMSVASIFVGDSNDLINDFEIPWNEAQNATEDNVNKIVNFYNSTHDPLPANLTLLGKWEVSENRWENSDPEFTGTFIGGGTSGTWSAPVGWLATDPIYYSLKAATQFALYYANGATSGDWEIDWTTPGQGNATPGLSHISFWTADPPNPVPEPGTLALVGLGLATLAGYRRKRHSS
jgi:hypothetical protein